MKLKRGDIVAIEIYDHWKGNAMCQIRPLVAYGRYYSENKTYITIDYWTYADETIERDCNIETVDIVKGAIKKITKLIPQK